MVNPCVALSKTFGSSVPEISALYIPLRKMAFLFIQLAIGVRSTKSPERDWGKVCQHDLSTHTLLYNLIYKDSGRLLDLILKLFRSLLFTERLPGGRACFHHPVCDTDFLEAYRGFFILKLYQKTQDPVVSYYI